MTDSETDTIPNNMFSFQHQNTTISAKGPNVNNTNLSSMSFRNNNMLTSTINGPWNMERPRYAETAYDQRSMPSMYYRREHSPSSFHSASGFRGRNMPSNSYYPGGMSSNRSMYNGRAGSPCGSVRTVDSNTTVSAMDIASAFKTMQFSKFDLRIIKDAYNKFFKQKVRRRIEKRRNLRLYMRGSRRKSGYDSGELGSNSSESSDDCRSTRSCRTIYRDNGSSSCRSTRTNLSDLRRSMKESSMYIDCTENFRQNTFRNRLFPPNPMQQMPHHQQPMSSMMQKDRFQNGYTLPSQRFNHSIASQRIPEKSIYRQQDTELERFRERDRQIHQQQLQRNDSAEMNSEQDEIFTEVTVMDKAACNAKRGLDEVETLPNNKRSKTSSPQKKTKPKTPKQSETAKENKSTDFVFAKPHFPVKKPGGKVQKKVVVQSSQPLGVMNKSLLLQQPPQQEKLISRSKSIDEVLKSPPIMANGHISKYNTPKQKPTKGHQTEILISQSNQPEEVKSKLHPVEQLISKSTQPLEDLGNLPKMLVENSHSETLQNTTDVSMRPSFIKRKLYTQKLEEKNASSDSLEQNSPQGNIYSAIQKEKNKTRKLITQSCLSRDVLGDESNLLDLIHKIVPPDRMNVTSANKSDTNKSKPGKDAKWDVSSVIDKCKEDDVSDTFTDEDIFTDTLKTKETVTKPKETTKPKQTVATPKEPVAKARETVAKPKEAVVKPKKTVTKTKDMVANPKETITKPKETITKPKEPVAKPKELVAKLKEPVAKPKETVTKPKEPVAKLKEIETKSKETAVQPKKTVTKAKDIEINSEDLKPNKKIAKAVNENEKAKQQGIVIQTKQKKVKTTKVAEKQCKVMVAKMSTEYSDVKVTPVKDGTAKSVYNCVKSFWDTDAESDLETTPLRINILQESRRKDISIRQCYNQQKEVEVTAPPAATAPAKATAKNNTFKKQNKTTNTKSTTKESDKPNETNKPEIVTEIRQPETTNEKPNKIIGKSKNITKAAHDGEALNTNDKSKPIKQKTSTKITLNNNSSIENNVTICTRPCRTLKIKSCCEDQPKNGSLNSSSDTTIRSLRNRDVDLSTSMQSIKADPPIKKAAVKKSVTTKLVVGTEQNSSSDFSFTLAMDTTILTRRQHARLQELTRKRPSDVSFSIPTEPAVKRSARINNSKINDSIKTDISLAKHNKSEIVISRAKNNSRITKRTVACKK